MANQISYKINQPLETQDIIEVFDSSGINRPTNEPEKIAKMFANSNLLISAWDGDLLVGISRSVTDFSYCCYLSDLAVRKDYQKAGIGDELIRLTFDNIGESKMLLLISSPEAMEYYPKVGFKKIDSTFVLRES